MLLLAHTEEASKGHHRVDGLPAYLVDHDVIDRSELFALKVVDVGALDLFGRDQGAGCDLGNVCHRSLLSLRPCWLQSAANRTGGAQPSLPARFPAQPLSVP